MIRRQIIMLWVSRSIDCTNTWHRWVFWVFVFVTFSRNQYRWLKMNWMVERRQVKTKVEHSRYGHLEYTLNVMIATLKAFKLNLLKLGYSRCPLMFIGVVQCEGSSYKMFRNRLKIVSILWKKYVFTFFASTSSQKRE